MCLRVVERYAVCGCIYHVHGIDACSAYGRHSVADRIVHVGYACPTHSRGPTSYTSYFDRTPNVELRDIKIEFRSDSLLDAHLDDSCGGSAQQQTICILAHEEQQPAAAVR